LTPLRPTAPIAADALLPGDPARALRLAQELLVQPKMSNHAHGLWGYGGETEDGQQLTIQSVGIGGPSAALVLADLAGLGVGRAIQVGTCRAVAPELRLGDLLVVRQALAADGASRELAGKPALGPDAELGAALAAVALEGAREATVASADLVGELDGRPADEWRRRGAVAVEMAAAALFATGQRRGVAVGSVLAVSDADGVAIDDEDLERASLRMGQLAVSALSMLNAD
jgi:uridine phosphorylase